MAQSVILNVNVNTQQALRGIGQLNNGISTTLNTINDLEAASQSLTEQLRNTQRGTAAFTALSQQLNVVNTELRNAELNMEVLDNEQLVGSVKGLAGGLTDVAGGLALIGVSGEGIEKIAETFAQVEGVSRVIGGALDVYNEGMKVMRAVTVAATAAQTRLVAGNTALSASQAATTASTTLSQRATQAQTLATNLQTRANLGGTNAANLQAGANRAQALANRLNTQATTQAAAATTAQGNASAFATIKMKALNLIMNANPVFLLITGVALLAGGLYALSSAMDDDKISAEQLNAEYEKLNANMNLVNAAANREIEARVNSAKQNLDLAKARGASEQEVYDLTIKLYGAEEQARLTRMSDIKTDIGDLRDERKKAIENENYDLAKQIADQIITKKESYKDLVAQEGDYKNKVDLLVAETNTNRTNKEREANDKIIAERLSHFDKLKAIAKKLADDEEIDYAATEEKKLQILYERQKTEIESENKLAGDTKETRAVMNAALVDLEEKLKNDINDIVTKREQEKLKIQEDAIEEARKLNQQQLVNDANLVQDGLDKANDLGKSARQKELQDIGDYYNERIEAARKLYGEESEEYIKLVTARGSEEERINNEFNKKEKEERLQRNADIAAEIANTVQATTDIISQILQNRNALEEFYRNERFTKEDDALKNSLANRLITQEEYDAKVSLLNQKKREEEKKAAMKAFKQQKAIAILNATMQTAQAVLAGYSSGMAYPLIGPATGAVFAGIAAGIGAAQIAVIASQKFTAARGGVVPGTGPSSIDSVDALLAPGEMVINANSARMFAPVLSDINQAGGGVALAPSSPDNGTSSSNGGRQIVEAYVVESQITDVQNRVDRFKRRKEF